MVRFDRGENGVKGTAGSAREERVSLSGPAPEAVRFPRPSRHVASTCASAPVLSARISYFGASRPEGEGSPDMSDFYGPRFKISLQSTMKISRREKPTNRG